MQKYIKFVTKKKKLKTTIYFKLFIPRTSFEKKINDM